MSCFSVSKVVRFILFLFTKLQHAAIKLSTEFLHQGKLISEG
ncbi:hypothetical protein C427_0038 [Paraglaciecola psychrophila 170]|uniref:Uncharacterized protein n=1 Tax=Paraglaciecola psychrophila 170 TaxID=1129794 RepID=M4RHV3_9ALTE|nr:hypothetical protein C427_0038 [Paraglaciecola psychrophila 170]